MYIKTLRPVLSQINVRSSAQVNPHASIAENIIEHKCRELGIWLPQLKDYTTMSAYLFPTASVQRLVTLGTYNNFLFFIDDQFDRHAKEEINHEEEIYMRKVFDNCANILLNGHIPSGSHILYDTCIDLRKQFLSHTSELWLQRLVTSNLAHLKASTHTIEDIINSNADVVQGYINLRLLDAGMHPTIDGLEFARDIMLSDEIINSEYLRDMREIVSKIGALSNDLFSYTKEIVHTESRFNLVCVLEDYGGYSFEHAVMKSIEIVNESIDQFYAKTQQIPKWDDKQINKDVAIYVEGLRDIVIACWHWQISTNRYRSEYSPFPELRNPL